MCVPTHCIHTCSIILVTGRRISVDIQPVTAGIHINSTALLAHDKPTMYCYTLCIVSLLLALCCMRATSDRDTHKSGYACVVDKVHHV